MTNKLSSLMLVLSSFVAFAGANEFIIYSSSTTGADFDVAFAEVYEVP